MKRQIVNKINAMAALFALVLMGLAAGGASAGTALERAQDMMEANHFEEAYKELLPLANSGNADAEKLIGVMYAMGLGVEQDDRRAFEWYMRASMRGHPGAQTGVGWYYEVGRGVPAPDLVRAYLWYALSVLGGDPDGLITVGDVAQKMTPEQIAEAQALIHDYQGLLHPYR